MKTYVCRIYTFVLRPTRMAPVRCVGGCLYTTQWTRIIRTVWKPRIKVLNRGAVWLNKHSMLRIF